MDNTNRIAGSIGTRSIGDYYRLACAEADIVFGRAWVTGSVVVLAIIANAAMMTEASKPAPEHHQTVHAQPTPIERAWQSIAELHEVRIIQAMGQSHAETTEEN